MNDWTYSGDPSASSKDAVRFLCGDTSTASQLVTDSEITWTLSEEGNSYLAAALVCESIASLKTQEADITVGDLSISASQLSDAFAKKAAALRKRASVRGAGFYAGGISVSRTDTVEADTDRVDPFFKRTDFVYPTEDSGASTERT